MYFVATLTIGRVPASSRSLARKFHWRDFVTVADCFGNFGYFSLESKYFRTGMCGLLGSAFPRLVIFENFIELMKIFEQGTLT